MEGNDLALAKKRLYPSPEPRSTLNLSLILEFELVLDTSYKSTAYTEHIFLPNPNPSLEKMEGNDLALANKRLNTSPEPRSTLNLSLTLEFELALDTSDKSTFYTEHSFLPNPSPSLEKWKGMTSP